MLAEKNLRGHPLDFSRQPHVRISPQVNGLVCSESYKPLRYCVLISGYRDTVTQQSPIRIKRSKTAPWLSPQKIISATQVSTQFVRFVAHSPTP